MANHFFEGTWEELTQEADRLAGKQLRVEVLERDPQVTAPQDEGKVTDSVRTPKNLAELLGDYIGAVPGTGEALSERTGERLTDYLERKRRDGQL